MDTQLEKFMSGEQPIEGAGVDATQNDRPGVPMEKNPPAPAGNAHWLTPDRMTDPGYVQKRAGLEQLTPVFGTSCPPRGVSGMMRKAAYKIPEHFNAHWLLLMAADRVDVVEDRLKVLLPFALPLGAAALYFGMRAQRKTWLRTFFA